MKSTRLSMLLALTAALAVPCTLDDDIIDRPEPLPPPADGAPGSNPERAAKRRGRKQRQAQKKRRGWR